MNTHTPPAAEKFNIVIKTVPTFYFIGVTTGKSSINKVFPLWMKVFGRAEVVLEGMDCKIHDVPEVYREKVAQIKYDPLSVGALVTTHKIVENLVKGTPGSLGNLKIEGRWAAPFSFHIR